jgi:hypothetical protein
MKAERVAKVLLWIFVLIFLAMAVGSVVPPVGKVLAVEGQGVGGMFGYLAGAFIWGLVTWISLRAGRLPATAATADAAGADSAFGVSTGLVMPLPDGPGLGRRRLLATPLALLAAALPWIGAAGLRVWQREDRFAASPSIDDEAAPSFTERLLTEVGDPWQLIVPALVVAYLLLRRNAVASWPAACALGAGFVLFRSVDTVEAPDIGPVPGYVASFTFAFLLTLGSYQLAALAGYVLTRPIATDVARSRLELSFGLPGQGPLPPQPRLRIRHDQLVLSGLGQRRDDVTQREIPLPALVEARVGTTRRPYEWKPVFGCNQTVTVPAGPVLLLRGAAQNWVVPFEDKATARAALALITARARRHM